MPTKESPDVVSTLLRLGIKVDNLDLEHVTLNDVETLCNYRYPFLQLINADAIFAEETSIEFIKAQTGWTIHDYGDAISTCAPHNNVTRGQCSRKNQIDTASIIAKLIATKAAAPNTTWGGKKIEVIGGTELLIRALEIEVLRYDFTIKKPQESNTDDERRIDYFKKHLQRCGLSWEQQVPHEQQLKKNLLVSATTNNN